MSKSRIPPRCFSRLTVNMFFGYSLKLSERRDLQGISQRVIVWSMRLCMLIFNLLLVCTCRIDSCLYKCRAWTKPRNQGVSSQGLIVVSEDSRPREATALKINQKVMSMSRCTAPSSILSLDSKSCFCFCLLCQFPFQANAELERYLEIKEFLAKDSSEQVQTLDRVTRDATVLKINQKVMSRRYNALTVDLELTREKLARTSREFFDIEKVSYLRAVTGLRFAPIYTPAVFDITIVDPFSATKRSYQRILVFWFPSTL